MKATSWELNLEKGRSWAERKIEGGEHPDAVLRKSLYGMEKARTADRRAFHEGAVEHASLASRARELRELEREIERARQAGEEWALAGW